MSRAFKQIKCNEFIVSGNPDNTLKNNNGYIEFLTGNQINLGTVENVLSGNGALNPNVNISYIGTGTSFSLGTATFNGTQKSIFKPIDTILTNTNRFAQAGPFGITNSSTIGVLPPGQVYSTCFDSNKNIYLGGNFFGAGYVYSPNIIKWNRSSYEPVVLGLTGPGGLTIVNSVVFSSTGPTANFLFAGGAVTSGNVTGVVGLNGIAAYNTVTNRWSDITGSSPAGANYVKLSTDNAGNVYGISGATVCYRWNGTGGRTTIVSNTNAGPINTILSVSPSEVYVGLDIVASDKTITYNGTGYPAPYGYSQFNGTGWITPYNGADPGLSSITSMTLDKSGNLVLCGYTTGAKIQCIRWNGTGYTKYSTIDTNFPNNPLYKIYDTSVDSNNNLYIVGEFFNQTTPVIPLNRIGKINLNSGGNWSCPFSFPNGTGANAIIRSVLINENNSLFVGGGFTGIGGATAAAVASTFGSYPSTTISGNFVKDIAPYTTATIPLSSVETGINSYLNLVYDQILGKWIVVDNSNNILFS